MIKNLNYFNSEIFINEQTLIFETNWVYICLKEQLNEINDFVTYESGNINIVLHRFKDGIKCFENICSHRFNKIHKDKYGNSPFYCKYHSWVYNSNGQVVGQENFKNELQNKNRECLKEYEVGICGNFVFVNLSLKSNISLKEHLGDFFFILEDLSSNFDGVLNNEHIEIEHNSNWKLLVENVLECYHCSSVHKETLVPIGIGFKKPEKHFVYRYHDCIDYPVSINKVDPSREKKLKFIDKSTFQHKSLKHFYIFPNLFISSTEGILFYVGRLMPTKPEKTTLVVNFIKPKFYNLSSSEDFLVRAFYGSPIEYFTRVIFEDKTILEGVQKNIVTIPEKTQIFGDEEFRIKNFHEQLANIINYF